MNTDGHALGEAGARLRMRAHERRIEGQHARLDGIANEVYTSIEKDGPEAAIDAFALYAAAVEAHMSLEEDVTFPRLHGLRPDLEGRLMRLIDEHRVLRGQLGTIRERLERGDGLGARFEFEALGRRLDRHERREETLLAQVNAVAGRARTPQA
ncbi:MAG: hemerythrin domain-containing protein [Myxococcota bacterium]